MGDDELPDERLLELLRREPERAWPLFLDRHGDRILGQLQRLGFGHDEAMDRFVYVCEKLHEDGCRRLRGVRHLDAEAGLGPWLYTVVRNLAVSWLWSREGRRRMLRPIARLPSTERRVFELYFWQGLLPTEIWSTLRSSGLPAVTLGEVFEALERVFARLGRKKLWRLLSRLNARRGELSLDAGSAERLELASPAPSAEELLLRREGEALLQRALAACSPAERLLLGLRFEEDLSFEQIGQALDLSAREARRDVHRALASLRQAIEDGARAPAARAREETA